MSQHLFQIRAQTMFETIAIHIRLEDCSYFWKDFHLIVPQLEWSLNTLWFCLSLSHSSNMQLHFLSNKKPCIPPDQNIHGAGISGSSIFMQPTTSLSTCWKLGAVISPTSEITKIPSFLDGEIHEILGCRHETQQFTTGPLCVACLRLQFARQRRVSAPDCLQQCFGRGNYVT